MPGLARPGRPDDHRQGKADRQPARSAPASRSADKLSLTASIKQENVFGSGNYLGLEVNTSKYNRTLVLSTVDPYFTIDGISRAIDVYYRTTQPINSQGEEYELVTPGRRRSASAFRSASTTRCSSASASSAPRSARRRSCRTATSLYREQFGDTSTSRAADHRLDARRPRQRPGADRGPLHSASTLDWASPATPLPAHQPAVPAVLPAAPRRSPSASTPRSATARAWATGPTRSSRTSTAAAWARCAASTRARSARSTSPAPTSAATGAST